MVQELGKTTTAIEPMIARDIEKKYFFREIGKEMAFAALKSGIATLSVPYNNEYVNTNFNLNMLSVNSLKSTLFKEYMKNMVYFESSSETIYKNLGVTAISPDFESTKHLLDVARNYSIPVNVIDPSNPISIGLNPFAQDNVSQIATSISSVLRTMYLTTHTDAEETFMENIAYQAIENLSILLGVMYPKLNNGDLPNLEDMLKMLNNFDLVEKMCEKLKEDPILSTKYDMQIGYFEKNFYKPRQDEKSYYGYSRADTERFVYSAITQLDNLLRHPGVKAVLCNRRNNVNFDIALANGEFTFACTRRGELGDATHKAFGMFIILLLQHAVLRRSGVEKSRIPHFLYIDEFPDFICKATEPLFTTYRKYRCGTIVTTQNLAQLGGIDNKKEYKETIIANCNTKMVFGNATPEDIVFWETEFGKKRDWKMQFKYETNKFSYAPDLGNVEYYWKEYYKANQIQDRKFKALTYKTKDTKGKNIIGIGLTDFLEEKYKKSHECKTFGFDKYGVSTDKDSPSAEIKKETNIKPTFKLEDTEDADPIVYNESSSASLFNGDGMIFNLKKKQ